MSDRIQEIEKLMEEVEQYDDSWWLGFLKEKSIFDTDNIKAQKEALVQSVDYLLQQVKQMNEALEIYADRGNWTFKNPSEFRFHEPWNIARQAQKGDSNER